MALPDEDTLLVQLRSQSPRERSHAALELGRVRSERALPVLVELLGGRDDSCEEVAWALGEIGGPGAAQALIAALGDEDHVIRESAADALGGMGWAPARTDLEALAAQDPMAPTRRRALVALTEIGDARSCPVFAKTLSDADPAVRWQAARALALTGCDGARATIEAATEREPDRIAREQMTLALDPLS